MVSCTENYNDRLLDIKKVVFVTGGGLNDIVVSIAACLSLINYYCPSCEEINILLFTGSNLVKGLITSEEFYRRWLNLPKIDNRLKFVGNENFIGGGFERTSSKWSSFLLENLNLGETSLFYEDSKELKWNSIPGGEYPKNIPLYIDKINKVLYITSFSTSISFKSRGFPNRENEFRLLNWNDELEQSYKKNVIHCYESLITNELRSFITKEDLKNCIGLHLRVDNYWPEMLERIIEKWGYDVINDTSKEYNISKIVNNMKYNNFGEDFITSCNEITNSHIRNYERFIMKKEMQGKKIFFASDCPVTANYFTKKYSNVIQYEKYEISDLYKEWFFDEYILDPYSRKNNYIRQNSKDQWNDSKYIEFGYNRCLYDYICILKCGFVFLGSGGFSNYLFNKPEETQFHLGIEDEIMENYQNIGI